MGVGKTLKEERKRRGLTQKEFSKDIVTISYYSKIEKELHSITIEILLELLAVNNIDINYFFTKLQNEKGLDTYRNSILSQISNAYFQKDIPFLSELSNEVKSHDNYEDKEIQFLSSLIELTKASILEDLESLSLDVKELLQTKVFDLLSWDKFKLSLYSQIIELYDIESNIIMINSILAKGIDSYPFENQVYILTAILNFTSICIEKGQDSLALGYIKIIENQPTYPENFFQKLINRYFNLLLLKRLNQDIDEQDLESIYKVISISGMKTYSKSLKEFFEKNK